MDEVIHAFPIGISIHTLRMEGDLRAEGKTLDSMLISIHTLRMEGDSKFA